MVVDTGQAVCRYGQLERTEIRVQVDSSLISEHVFRLPLLHKMAGPSPRPHMVVLPHPPMVDADITQYDVYFKMLELTGRLHKSNPLVRTLISTFMKYYESREANPPEGDWGLLRVFF